MQTVRADSPSVSYTGRVAVLEDGAHFYWPGSEAAVRFTGTQLSCTAVVNDIWGTNSLGLIVDGRESRIPVTPRDNGKVMTFLLAENLDPAGVHTVQVYKRLDCSYSYVLCSFTAEGAFLPPEEKPERRLEFYGDSVTAGACVECVDYVGLTDPCSNASCFDNSRYSYASMIGRDLRAQTHLVAQGGIAVMSGTGYFHYPDGIGMDVSWDRLCYFPEAGEYTKWDFSRFVPHACVFALGQNDQHNPSTGQNDFSAREPAHRAAWKARYGAIIRGVASKYPPGIPLVLITTLIRHDPAWDEAIGELAAELRTEGLNASQFLFTRNGDGTNGHPRIPEQREMADELGAYLKRLLSWN